MDKDKRIKHLDKLIKNLDEELELNFKTIEQLRDNIKSLNETRQIFYDVVNILTNQI